MKRLKNLLFTMLLALLAWNCQKEEATVPEPESVVETKTKPFEGRRTIALEEVPDIEGFLSSSLSKRKGYAFKKDNGNVSDMVVTPFGQIPLEDILEVTDTLGNFNYTFRILPNSYIGNRFYNLVVHKKEGEKDISAFVVEYEMDAGYAQDYMAKTVHFGQFSGKVRTYGFEAFLDKQDKRAIASKACEEEKTLYALEPCEEYEIENGEPNDALPPPNDPVNDGNQGPGGPGGGGGGGGGGDMPPGPGVMCAASGLYVTGCGGSNSGDLHSVGSCQGPNMMGGNFYMQYNCSDGSTKYEDLKAEDCADGGAGPVGIAPVSFHSLSFALGLDFAQQQWLEANCEQKNDLYQFLNSHLDEEGDWREDAKDFAREALDAWIDGGEVDFEEKLIIDSSVSPCVQNIIGPLISKSNYISIVPNLPVDINLSSLILDLFSNSSNHNYQIQVGSLGNSVNAQTVPSHMGGGVFLYTTTLNSSYVSNATDLAIARTIIHESVHAYLSYLYQDQPFSSTSAILRHHLAQNGYNTNAAQHQFMVQYVDAIAYSLQNWDNNSLGGIQYYRYLPWSGDMLNTPDFAQLSPSFQNNVTNANIAEGQAGSGNGSTLAAQGTNNCH
ncbi:MAG: hypothetical protein ACX93O_15140 [Flagellimonas sp.]